MHVALVAASLRDNPVNNIDTPSVDFGLPGRARPFQLTGKRETQAQSR